MSQEQDVREQNTLTAGRIAETISERITRFPAGKRLLVAVDGRAAAGKSTIAQELQKRTGCNVVHADDFYLHPVQRTAARYAEPGGNIDYERLHRDVIEPWQKTGAFSYAPYDAHKDLYGEVMHFVPSPVTVVEGAYSAHPVLARAYDLIVFVTTSPEVQRTRIAQRNGTAALRMFQDKWIPLEERYIAETSAEQRSDIVFRT